jgi:phosphate-selective porin OprO and OprP
MGQSAQVKIMRILTLLSLAAVALLSAGAALGESVTYVNSDPESKSSLLQEEKTFLPGLHVFWKRGIHIDSPERNVRIKIGGQLFVDGGDIEADGGLEAAFRDLDGSDIQVRKGELDISAGIYDRVRGKFQVNLVDLGEIKDNWLDVRKIPLVGHIRFGHMKEPFSLEEVTSAKNLTFMERALPTEAFTPGRNMGVMLHNAVLQERMTWALGSFADTGSFSDLEAPKDRIDDANGFGISTRVTGLPWYEDRGKRLFHLGFSYTHQFQGDVKDDAEVRFRTRPESHLTGDRLVDTGSFAADTVDMISPELAVVFGPFSFQGEYTRVFVNADALDDPGFWGVYLYGSYMLTGEHRDYDTSSGVFSGVKPKHDFHFLKDGWGAWELGFRYSRVDLNDGRVKGGKEYNITAGLNWYINTTSRIMFNYIRVNVEDRENPPSVDSGDADILQVRFQIVF